MPGHLIRRLHQISTSIFAEEMAQAGFDITPVQYAALSALSVHPGIDQNTLAGLVAHDRATMGGVVDRLERRGYVQREVSPVDRRARVLRLTDKGLTLMFAVAPAVRRVQDAILSPLDAESSAMLLTLINKVTDAGNERARAPLRLPGDKDAGARET